MIHPYRTCLVAAWVVLSMAVVQLRTDEKHEPDKNREAARETVLAHLARLKHAKSGQLLDIKAACLKRTFKGSSFFVLRFRQFPVGIVPPPPLKTNNVFVVSGDKVTHITDEKALEKFFKKDLLTTATGKAMAEATRSWLWLARELHQDGFFRFKKPSVEVSDNSSEGVVEVVPEGGNKGRLTVKMAFARGRLRSVTAGGKVIPGIRPICQATRLLDEDPVIREIMRRDILVMGRACKWYLDEVRAEADLDLQRAIDEVWQRILDEER